MQALITAWNLDMRAIAPNAPARITRRVGQDLVARWTEPARRYHTTTHLVEMFGALEELEDSGAVDDRQCSLARLAAWWHDAVYDPRASPGSNEADSAALAQALLTELGVGGDEIEAIDRLIRLTARHDADASEPLDASFHDADLWILSAPHERFDGYCDQIRQEYAHVPAREYSVARAAILGPLVHRDRIYRTPRALEAWEMPARVNLDRELTRLRLDH